MNHKSFIQKLNPISGRIEWDYADEDYDYHQEIARAAYADMLHDTERNKKYGDALRVAINKIHSRGKRAHVLDIGTGTGLLSMLAAKFNADTVTACEAFLPMANCAIEIIKENNFSNITVVRKHSTDLTVGENGDMKQRANILVTEVFDTELIGEGAINTFNHAHEYLIEEDCIIIPSQAIIYAQVIESNLGQKWNRIHKWLDDEKDLVCIPDEFIKCRGAAAVHDIQLSVLPQSQFTPLTDCIPVFTLLADKQKENHVSFGTELKDDLGADPDLMVKFITGDESWVYCYDPEAKSQSSNGTGMEIMQYKVSGNLLLTYTCRFDWSEKKFPKTRHNLSSLEVHTSGRAQMVFMWWELIMDTESQITLSCAPIWEHPLTKAVIKARGPGYTKGVDTTTEANHFHSISSIPWRDHWMQAIYYFPSESVLSSDNDFYLLSSHDEYSLWFNIIPNNELTANVQVDSKIKNCNDKNSRPVCDCGIHFLLSRTRIGAMNDVYRRQKYVRTLNRKISENSIVIVFGDVSLLSLVASKLGGMKIYVLERNELHRKIMGKIVNTNNAGNKISLCSSFDDIVKCLCNDFPKTDNMDMVLISEPFFTSSVVPWDNIRFWYLKEEFLQSIENKIQNSHSSVKCLLNNIKIMPQKGYLYGMAVEFDNLWKIRAPVNSCEGFKMKNFDDLITDSSNKADSTTEAQPLWEYPCKSLTAPIQLSSFNFVDSLPLSTISNSGIFHFQCLGVCDGIALWMEYELDDEERMSLGPVSEPSLNEYVLWDKYERQGVYLFRNRQNVTKGSELKYNVEFNPTKAELIFTFSM